MKNRSRKVVFFGSGPVAAESLKLLLDSFEVEAVITKPRPMHHKGSVPVLELAASLGLKTYVASNKKELDIIIDEQNFLSKVGILIDFGVIVSQKVIDAFPFGIVNSHFSLLPEWRGADPITFAILSGQEVTGVSLMLLVRAMDEGPVLATGTYDISNSTTTPELTHELIILSDKMLKLIIPKYLEGSIQPIDQPSDGSATYSRKLTKNDGIIDWNKDAVQIERDIRAFIEWPKSKTRLGEVDVVVTKAHVVEQLQGEPGTLLHDTKSIVVQCGKNALSIDLLKPLGKKEMTAQAFLAGYSKHIN